MSDTIWRKQYEWRPTHGGRPRDDWSAYDGKLLIGRIWREYKVPAKQGLFGWEGGRGGSTGLANGGWETSHRRAMQAVEHVYQSKIGAPHALKMQR